MRYAPIALMVSAAVVSTSCLVRPHPPVTARATIQGDQLRLPALGGTGRPLLLRGDWVSRPDGSVCLDGGALELPVGLRLVGVRSCARLDPFMLEGSAQIGFPERGELAGVLQVEGQRVSFRFDTGGAMKPYQIDGLPVNLRDDRYYLELRFDSGAAARLGGVSVGSAGGTQATVLIEPTEPLLYMAGELGGAAGKMVDEAAFAISPAGRLRYEARRRLPRRVRAISGQVFTRAVVKLGKYPAEVDGEVVFAFRDGLQIGANGTLNLVAGIGSYSLQVELGNASMTYDSATGGVGSLVFAGGKSKGLFSGTPLAVLKPPSRDVAVDGYFLSLTDFAFHLQNDFEVLGFLLQRADVELGPRGARVEGRMRLPGTMGEVQMSGTIGNDRVFELTGRADLDLNGLKLVGASLSLSPRGLAVSGAVRLPGAGSVAVSGSIESNGKFALAGRGTIAPLGFKLANASVSVGPRGAEVTAKARVLSAHFAVKGLIGPRTIRITGSTGLKFGPFRGTASLSISERRVQTTVDGRACLGPKCVPLAGMEVDTKGRVCPVWPVLGKKCIKVM